MNSKDFFLLPNILSLSRILFGGLIVALFFYITNNDFADKKNLIIYSIILILYIIGIITDGLDGYFARKMNIVTDLGRHLDPFTDSIFFILVFFAFVYVSLMPWYLLVLIIIREITMHGFLRPLAKKRGGSLPANIYGKLKTFMQSILTAIILTLLLIYHGGLYKTNSFNHIIETFSLISFILIVFLSLMSIFIYIVNFNKYLKVS